MQGWGRGRRPRWPLRFWLEHLDELWLLFTEMGEIGREPSFVALPSGDHWSRCFFLDSFNVTCFLGTQNEWALGPNYSLALFTSYPCSSLSTYLCGLRVLFKIKIRSCHLKSERTSSCIGDKFLSFLNPDNPLLMVRFFPSPWTFFLPSTNACSCVRTLYLLSCPPGPPSPCSLDGVLSWRGLPRLPYLK